MLLQEPAESPYDFRFNVFGFPVRVTWTFWLGALVFGYALAVGLSEQFEQASIYRLVYLVLWALCLLVSILVHELGHAFAFRRCGVESSIVLYHFGGLAIPRSTFGSSRGSGRLTVPQELGIAAAGPALQIASAAVLIGLVKLSGYSVAYVTGFLPFGLSSLVGTDAGRPIENGKLVALLIFYVWPSVMWALLNLIPVWPLDGGRIMRAIVQLLGGNTEQSLWISVIVAGLMTLYGFRSGSFFLGILFLSLAITSFQLLQSDRNWRY